MMKLRTAEHSVLLAALLALSACNNPPAPKVTATPPTDRIAPTASFAAAKTSGASSVLIGDKTMV